MRIEAISGSTQVVAHGSIISFNNEAIQLLLKDITRAGDDFTLHFVFLKDDTNKEARLTSEGTGKVLIYNLYNFNDMLGRGLFTPVEFARAGNIRFLISFIVYCLGNGVAHKISYSIYRA